MNFRVLTLEDTKELKEVLARFAPVDIHVDPRYLCLFQDYTGQKALYFHGIFPEGEFLQPFFERPLPEIGDGRVYKDIISPWYFGGPISNFGSLEIAKKEYIKFLAHIDEYCLANNVISQFQRLNPELDNYLLYDADERLFYNRKVVSVDLTKSEETIQSGYKNKVMRDVRRAQKNGLTIVQSNKTENIRQFIDVYTASMDRKSAGQFYYFNERFFTDLFSTLPQEAQLFVAYKDDHVAATQLVLGNGTILYDYLRAASPEFLSIRPNELLFNNIILWAKKTGYKEYSLGGGNSSSESDPLFKFKSSFSPFTKDFYLYKKVHNREAYIKRCVAEGKNPEDVKYEKADYFPEYKTA